MEEPVDPPGTVLTHLTILFYYSIFKVYKLKLFSNIFFYEVEFHDQLSTTTGLWQLKLF